MIKKLILTLILATSCLTASDKIYINDEDLDQSQDSFMIHKGHNVWIETNTVHRDKTGLYTFESNIIRSNHRKDLVEYWKCPYCYMYWPRGTPCQNSNCPSRYP